MGIAYGVSGFLDTGGYSVPSNMRNIVTTTRTRDDVATSLTNINTKSDAWGKVIPMSFGRVRVGGALIWASPFYKTLETWDDTTTEASGVTWTQQPIQDDLYTYRNYADGVFTHEATRPPPQGPQDIITPKGSQVTHGSMEAAFIDLCYSFGTEGDPRKKRYIEKVRINDTIVFDRTQPYIMDGLGFTIRYGYNNNIPPVMEKFPNGKFYYKDQTLLIFEKFPLALFGNSVPDSIDVEWGCCQAQISTYNPIPCDFHLDVNNYGQVAPLYYGKGDLSFYTYEPGALLIYYTRYPIGARNVVDDSFSTIKAQNQGIYSYEVGAKILTTQEAADINDEARQLTSSKSLILLQSYSPHNGNSMPPGSVTQAKWTFVPAGQPVNLDAALNNGQGVCIMYETQELANELQGSAVDASHSVQAGDRVGNSQGQIAPDGGWMIFSCVIVNPCGSVG